MEFDFLIATLVNLGVNLAYTLVALYLGIAFLGIIDKRLLKKIDLEEEIQKGNVAAAIFASTILLFVALIVTFGFKS